MLCSKQNKIALVDLLDFEVVEHFAKAWQIQPKEVVKWQFDLFSNHHALFNQLNPQNQEALHTEFCAKYTAIEQLDFCTLTNNTNLIHDAMALKKRLTKNNPPKWLVMNQMHKTTYVQHEILELISWMITVISLSKRLAINNKA